MAEDLNDLAHELWATAQLIPNESIEDGVSRIKETLNSVFAVRAVQREIWRMGYDRYEKLRKLNVFEYQSILVENLETGIPFDTLVDRLSGKGDQ